MINGVGERLGPDADEFVAHLKARGVDVATDALDEEPPWDDDIDEDLTAIYEAIDDTRDDVNHL